MTERRESYSADQLPFTCHATLTQPYYQSWRLLLESDMVTQQKSP